jgi:NADPH2:quinone reductase
MAKRIWLTEHGGPEVMQLQEFDLPEPGAGEVLIEQTAIGLNYIDIYQRRGFYPHPIPGGLGLEGAGRVAATGEAVTGLSVGDRVAYSGLMGAYATHRIAPANRLVPIPDGIGDRDAAALLFKGLTVEYLMERLHPVQPGEDVLFYAASGGVGQIAGQWGRHLGAHMIGVTSGPENCAMIRELGYDAAIDRLSEDIGARARELTDGRGVSVVYDSAGKATFEASLAALRPRGMFVSFGSATGDAPDVPPSRLQHAGSLFFTRPMLAHYIATDEEYHAAAQRVFALASEGVIKVNVNQTFRLSGVASAHEALASGETTGSTVILP